MWFPFFKKNKRRRSVPLYLFNTRAQEKQVFDLPSGISKVRMYNCGPTVYGVQHIGNLGMFVFTDVLRRVLEYNNFEVKQTINFTDVGHLSGDNDGDPDAGEDRMTKGLKRDGLKPTIENMRALGEKYGKIFLENISSLNIDTDRITFPRASDYIDADIALIKTLDEKGYTYTTELGVYFDTAQFPDYGKLGNIELSGLKEGARVAVQTEKHNPTDFILWKRDKKIGWESPWGKGFPGWHIECSAMIRATLGQQIDIHTGGIEHIAVHHNNEIAQSEAATGKKPLSRFWLHRAHIQIEGVKFAKSKGNVLYLSEILERGFHPHALRYLFLGAHYRTSSNFTWDALAAAQTAFLKLRHIVETYPTGGTVPAHYQREWHERANDDLDTPGVLASMWGMIKDPSLPEADIRAGILDADKIMGLGFDKRDEQAHALLREVHGEEVSFGSLPEPLQKMIKDRDEARKKSDWGHADSLRKRIETQGYTIKDGPGGAQRVFKK